MAGYVGVETKTNPDENVNELDIRIHAASEEKKVSINDSVVVVLPSHREETH